MQSIASKVVMLCITTKAFASPSHMAAVSVKEDGVPEVVDLKEIIDLEIADADRFASVREAEWQQHLRGIEYAREKVHDAIGNLNAKHQTGSDALLDIQEAKDKLRKEELSMFSVEKKNGILSSNVIHNLDSNLDEARRQIQEARAKMNSEPLLPFAEDEEEAAKEAMEDVDELIKIPNDLLPAHPSHTMMEAPNEWRVFMDKEEAIAASKVLNEPSKEELQEQEEQELMKDLSHTIAEVDGFTQQFESQLQQRLGNIQEARSQIRESMQLVDKLKNPSLDAQQQAKALEEVKQAKAKLDGEHLAMLAMSQRQPVLSNHIIDNLDDHLDEARQLIKEARAQLAAEPPLFPGEHFKETEAPADHEQALKDIQRDVRTVRAAMSQQNGASVVRTELV